MDTRLATAASEGSQNPAVDLDLRGIVKRFGSVTALAGVDLSIRAGELLTILGPSGSGKTTLLKVVAGFETPDEGTVLLSGRDVTSAAASKRDIGMVFQNYALFPHLTVGDNIAFPLEMRHVPRRDIDERVAWALQLVELSGYEKRLPKQLSGGQQQRVALARAIVFNPKMLLLDEPFGALDRKLREAMQLEVKRLQRRLNLTTIFITHDQEEALILSDRIAVMNHGRIEQLGLPRDIYARPVNRFVADFIGESNMFPGRLARREDGRLEVRLAGGASVIADMPTGAIGGEMGVLIRPEAAQLGPAAERLPNRFAGEIVETIYLGVSVKYRVALDAGFEAIVRCAASSESDSLDPGDRVTVGWATEDVHLVQWDRH